MMISHVSDRITSTVQDPEVTDKGQKPPLNPNRCLYEHSSAHWTRALTSKAMSRSARKHARVVRISDIFPMSTRVDADDSEAAEVLSNLISLCGDARATTMSTNVNKVEAPHTEHCRRSSKLLQFFRSQRHTASGPSRHIEEKPPANEVNPLSTMCASDFRSCRTTDL